MKKSVYLISGTGLPTKLVVVAFELEHATILDIENRFLRKERYSTVTPVHRAVVRLADPVFGPNDQAYFPGYDSAKIETAGGTNVVESDAEPGAVLTLSEQVYTSRCAYLITKTHEGQEVNVVVVADDSDTEHSKGLALVWGDRPGAGTIEVKYIGCGSFQVVPEIAEQGFKARVFPALHY